MNKIETKDRRANIDVDFNGNTLYISSNGFGVDIGIWNGDKRLNGIFIQNYNLRRVAYFIDKLAKEFDDGNYDEDECVECICKEQGNV
ncbi:MAG: hypothetical protein K6G15_00090 [Desulfovibrio sp.]|nr:hypothetical protein [Desulfovibrio sp.]